MKNSPCLMSSPMRKRRSIKFISEQLSVPYRTIYRCYQLDHEYCGVSLPRHHVLLGREIVFDSGEADKFIEDVLRFRQTHMRISEVAEYLDVATITVYRSQNTGMIMDAPIEKGVLLNEKLWWSRPAVELCWQYMTELKKRLEATRSAQI